jgi:hypothetical protein
MKRQFNQNIFIFSLFVIFFSIIVLFYSEETPEDVYGLIYMTPIIIIVILAISLNRLYRKTPDFNYGYLVLAVAFISHIMAEITWLLMDYLHFEHYQSYPDIFYFIYGIALLIHPWIIMQRFKIKPTKIAWVIFLLCMVAGNGIYCILSIDHYHEESFWFGLLFTILVTSLLGSTVIAIISLKDTKIFKIWILIGIAFLINAIGDIYYYASENFSDWTQGDLVNIAWFTSYIILIYALLKQHHEYDFRYKRN